MRPLDALARLKELLDQKQVPFEEDRCELRGRGEDWHRVWEAFCALAREPADEPFQQNGKRIRAGDASGYDLLLHESGATRDAPFLVDFARQFSFEDEDGDYAGMNRLSLSIECDRAPAGRIPQAQRWGYAGRLRDDEGNVSHPEVRNWAGWVDSWKRAVEVSNSFKVLGVIQPCRWSAFQDDC